MRNPPDPFKDHPDPLGIQVEPTEAIRHPAYGEVSAWIEESMSKPPSAGELGRVELLRHWNRLSREKRKVLLLLAREMDVTDCQ